MLVARVETTRLRRRRRKEEGEEDEVAAALMPSPYLSLRSFGKQGRRLCLLEEKDEGREEQGGEEDEAGGARQLRVLAFTNTPLPLPPAICFVVAITSMLLSLARALSRSIYLRRAASRAFSLSLFFFFLF